LKATPPTAAQYVVYSSLATISLFIMVVFVLVIRRAPMPNKAVDATAGKSLVEVGVLRAVPYLCVLLKNSV
jgi:hypothetical protein